MPLALGLGGLGVHYVPPVLNVYELSVYYSSYILLILSLSDCVFDKE